MYEIHPAALAFPELKKDSLKELVEDIKRNGLIVPIELYEGKVIDGRNRQKACQLAGVEPEYLELESLGGRSPAEYVWSLNGARRHMLPSQLAAIAVRLLPELKREAKERQKTSTGGAEPQLVEKLPQAEEPLKKGRSAAKAAEVVSVSEKYVREAAKLEQKAPEKFEEVLNGEKSLGQAKRELEAEQPCKPKPPKCGAEKTNAAHLIKESKKPIGLLMRLFDTFARLNGGQGEVHRRAGAAMGTVIECLQQMREGKL